MGMMSLMETGAERLLGRLVARFSLRTPVVDFRPVRVRFVVEWQGAIFVSSNSSVSCQ